MASYKVKSTVASVAGSNEARVTWATEGGEPGEMLTVFEVLVDGKLYGTTAAQTLVVSGLTEGPHTFRVKALVLHDIEGETASLEVSSAAGPRNKTEPTISGTAKVGQTLTAATGTWAGVGTTFAYRWVRTQNEHPSPWRVIAGAAGSTYVPVAADVGSRIRAIVIASSAFGTTTESISGTTAVVAA